MKSAVLPDELEVENKILEEYGSLQKLEQTEEWIQTHPIPSSAAKTCADNIHQDSIVSLEAQKLRPASKQASIFISSEVVPPKSSHITLESMPKVDSIGIHSNSTALVEDERQSHNEDDRVLFHHSISQILNWFKSVFSQINSSEKVTLKVLKLAAREYEVM